MRLVHTDRLMSVTRNFSCTLTCLRARTTRCDDVHLGCVIGLVAADRVRQRAEKQCGATGGSTLRWRSGQMRAPAGPDHRSEPQSTQGRLAARRYRSEITRSCPPCGLRQFSFDAVDRQRRAVAVKRSRARRSDRSGHRTYDLDAGARIVRSRRVAGRVRTRRGVLERRHRRADLHRQRPVPVRARFQNGQTVSGLRRWRKSGSHQKPWDDALWMVGSAPGRRPGRGRHRWSGARQAPGRKRCPGDVRGYDVRTGQSADVVIPRGGIRPRTWKDDRGREPAKGKVWSTVTADEDPGYVHPPSAAPMITGPRSGDNLFSDSLVCRRVD